MLTTTDKRRQRANLLQINLYTILYIYIYTLRNWSEILYLSIMYPYEQLDYLSLNPYPQLSTVRPGLGNMSATLWVVATKSSRKLSEVKGTYVFGHSTNQGRAAKR